MLGASFPEMVMAEPVLCKATKGNPNLGKDQALNQQIFKESRVKEQ